MTNVISRFKTTQPSGNMASGVAQTGPARTLHFARNGAVILGSLFLALLGICLLDAMDVFSGISAIYAAPLAQASDDKVISVIEAGAAYTVTSVADSGSGTLRQAINAANANPNLDTIVFNIPGPGPHTITPATRLPTITSPVIIDGYTQRGAISNTLTNGDNAVLMI